MLIPAFKKKKRNGGGDFPYCPVVKTLCFPCRGHGFEVRELGSQMLCGVVGLKKQTNKYQKQGRKLVVWGICLFFKFRDTVEQ